MSCGFRVAFLGGVLNALLIGPALACEPRNPKVYFGFDSVRPDPALFESELRDAARLANRPEVRRVTVSAFADAPGPASYNLRLSEARAKIVTRRLIELGVPAEKVSMEFFGESKLSVATGPDVAEPLNRYAEISGDWFVDPNCGMGRSPATPDARND